MRAIDLLTAIAENYEVGTGIGIFNTEHCEDLQDYTQHYFGRDIQVRGSIRAGYKYLYFYEHYDEGLMGAEHDAELISEYGKIYLYKID